MPSDGHGELLSPTDASFLHFESDHAHMHVAWCSILAPPANGARPTIAALRARVAARLDWVPRCRQRLLSAPLGLGDPRWVDDPDFDLAAHVQQLGEPDEGLTRARLGELRDALLSQPLDRARPLWHIALVPRLDDGGLAMVGRVHHAMADGAAALQVAMLLLDLDDTPDGDPNPWRPAAQPATMRRALDPLRQSVRLTGDVAREAARACGHPRRAARGVLRDGGRVMQALAEDLLPHAPRSQLNGPLGPRRTLAQHRVELTRLKAITRGVSATRNDVCLAAITGGLRALAQERDAAVEPLKALVPVNMRRPHHAALGNHVSLTSVWLPVDLGSPAARLEHVRRQTVRFKASSRPAGAATLLNALGAVLPGPLRAPVLRAATPGRFNLTISSVPGPPTALSMLGAPLREIYPAIPMAPQQALSVGTLAYGGQMHFGLYADPDAVPRPERLNELIDAEIDALSGSRRAPRSPLPVVAPVSAGRVGTYEKTAAAPRAVARGGAA